MKCLFFWQLFYVYFYDAIRRAVSNVNIRCIITLNDIMPILITDIYFYHDHFLHYRRVFKG